MVPDTTCLGCAPVMRERDVPQDLGVSRRKAQALIDEGVLLRLRRGVVVGSCVVERANGDRNLSHAIAIRTMLLSYHDCVASHESAAFLLDLPLLDVPPYAIGTRTAGAWRGGQRARIRISPLPAHHIVTAHGARCTAGARTVVDVARSASFRHAVVVGDAALRQLCTRSEMEVAFDECSAWADLGRARQSLKFFDARSESALESVSRAIMHERDVPAPEPQVTVEINPWTSYRLDFFWATEGVVGEADGMVKYESIDAVKAEKVRQERLERLGLKVIRWTWREMLVDTDETIARIRAALLR
jgi:hypothetical protein